MPQDIVQKKINKFAEPHLIKIVVSSGIGKLRENPKSRETVENNLAMITGQKPKVTKARKAISGFKVRENEEIGLMVTLRGKRMNDFLTKLAAMVLPRVRDFRGLSEKGFDKDGNYTIGFGEQVSFGEISGEKTEIIHGLAVTIVTSTDDKSEAKKLLEKLGLPFKKIVESSKKERK